MHNFTPRDHTQATNLARFLKKAKIELEGMEILAAADVIQWVGKLVRDIEVNLQSQQSLASVKSLEEPVAASKEAAPASASEPARKPRKSRSK